MKHSNELSNDPTDRMWSGKNNWTVVGYEVSQYFHHQRLSIYRIKHSEVGSVPNVWEVKYHEKGKVT